MIHFNLICKNQHQFDSWFASSSAYDDQQKAGLVTCPICDCGEVEKQLMTPAIASKSNRKTTTPEQTMLSSAGDPKMRELTESIRKMRQSVAENAEYVGKDFAKEAREIHYEEKPARGIYGQATLEEAKSLLEEGVDVTPLPDLPEDKN